MKKTVEENSPWADDPKQLLTSLKNPIILGSGIDLILSELWRISEINKKSPPGKKADIKKIIWQIYPVDCWFNGKRNIHFRDVCRNPVEFLRKVVEDLAKGNIAPDFQFPRIPPGQKKFTPAEVAKFTNRDPRTIRNDIVSEKLISEKEGRHRFVLRKNFLSYKRKLEK